METVGYSSAESLSVMREPKARDSTAERYAGLKYALAVN